MFVHTYYLLMKYQIKQTLFDLQNEGTVECTSSLITTILANNFSLVFTQMK